MEISMLISYPYLNLSKVQKGTTKQSSFDTGEVLLCFVLSWSYYQLSVDSGDIFRDAELNLSLRPANERRRYFVTTSLIGWVQAYN